MCADLVRKGRRRSVTGRRPLKLNVLKRRLPIGAEIVEGGTHFRVWAPSCRKVEVVLVDGDLNELQSYNLSPEENGYFSALAKGVGAGTLYRLRIDTSEMPCADPASRFQPDGPHGPSMVIDPSTYTWSDQDWKGAELNGQVVYEMHVGTFTQEGTWGAATEQLPELVELGVTLLEVMPLADFPGRFGWGYDGVNLFAPTRLYGAPDDVRRFIDRAHQLGIGVILDVVYNHLGPDGNYMPRLAECFFSKKHRTDWGQGLNFDGEDSAEVRRFILANVRYWIEEFHFDGLRIDATQDIHDDSPVHILSEISETVRDAAHGRATILIAENEPQQTRIVRPISENGFGLDALWNDDFHHSAMVVLTGHNEAYYTDYEGRPQEFISAAKYGYLFQGQHYVWQGKRRGTPSRGLSPAQFVNFIQNHDQIANSGRGQRCHELSSPGNYRAMTALLLLLPGTPMLFQGQEFAASSPFFYFADHHDHLARMVLAGRKQFMSQFRSIANPEMQAMLPDPADPATFMRSKLKFEERQQHRPVLDMHRDLLRLRREDEVLRKQGAEGLDGAVLGAEAFLLRYFSDDGLDRLLIVNFGRDLSLRPAPEPLLAPPAENSWTIYWSSEDPRYGGTGTPPIESDNGWLILGGAAVLLGPAACPLRRTGAGVSPPAQATAEKL